MQERHLKNHHMLPQILQIAKKLELSSLNNTGQNQKTLFNNESLKTLEKKLPNFTSRNASKNRYKLNYQSSVEFDEFQEQETEK